MLLIPDEAGDVRHTASLDSITLVPLLRSTLRTKYRTISLDRMGLGRDIQNELYAMGSHHASSASCVDKRLWQRITHFNQALTTRHKNSAGYPVGIGPCPDDIV